MYKRQLLAVTVEGEGVGGNGTVNLHWLASSDPLSPIENVLTTGVGEVDDVAVLLEHVDLLNALEGLNVQLLKSGLELLVIGTGVADNLLDLTAGSTLATGESLVFEIYEEGFCRRIADPNPNPNAYCDRDRGIRRNETGISG